MQIFTLTLPSPILGGLINRGIGIPPATDIGGGNKLKWVHIYETSQ